MGEAVKEGRGHPLALEHVVPLAERKVAGDEQAGSLVPVGEHLEEKLGADYAVRFDNPAGLPTGFTVLSQPYSDIESHVKSRLARLSEFMKELAT